MVKVDFKYSWVCVAAIFYGFISRSFQLAESGRFGIELLKSLFIFIAIMVAVNLIGLGLKKAFSIKSRLENSPRYFCNAAD